MRNKRHGLRAKCFEKCLLNLNGVNYQCVLGNISISGAVVSCEGTVPEVSPGSSCGLHLCSNLAVCPKEYRCQITRVAPSEIGLRFVNMS